MLPEVKQETTDRLKKIAGQVNGIQRMIDDERYCIDILTQIAAVRAAIDRVGMMVFKGHVKTCVSNAIKKGEGDMLIDELEKTMSKFLR
jgi:DNA-binding FrmR family transcriptional regulator